MTRTQRNIIASWGRTLDMCDKAQRLRRLLAADRRRYLTDAERAEQRRLVREVGELA